MDKHDDIEKWKFVMGEDKPLMLGAKVRLPHDHEYKGDWPDEYVIVGIVIDGDNNLDITIGDKLNHGTDRADGWCVDDLIAL
jgi:hypothetical protein